MRRSPWMFLVVFSLLSIVTFPAAAQSDFDTAPHLERLTLALTEGRFLDAYGEFFQINDSAPAAIEAVYEMQPESDAEKQTQAFFLALTGRAEAALTLVDSLPENAFTTTMKAIANDQLGKADDSAAALEQAIELAEDDAQVYGLVANAAFLSFNVESMMTNSRLALEIDPDLPLALRAHGLASLFSRDLQTALADSERGLEVAPRDYIFYTLQANIFLAMEQPDDALTALNAALTINPNSYVANAIRSSVNLILGNAEAAAQDFAASVNVKTIEIVEVAPLVAGESAALLMTLGKSFHLPFEAQADQRVSIHVVSTTPGEVDPVVMLLSPEGAPLAFNDDAGDDTLDAGIDAYMLPENGTYTIVVSHANSGSEGALTALLTFGDK